MAKIAHINRYLDSLIAGIIGAAPFLDSGLRRNDDEGGINIAATSVRYLNTLLRRHKPGKTGVRPDIPAMPFPDSSAACS